MENLKQGMQQPTNCCTYENGAREKSARVSPQQPISCCLYEVGACEKTAPARPQQQAHFCKYETGFFGGKFLPFHIGHLDCVLRCASECEKLYVVLMYNGEEEREILREYTGQFPRKCLDPRYREMAIRAQLRPFENIEVIAYDCAPAFKRSVAEGRHPWYYECQDMVSIMGRFDMAYSSEPEYSRTFREFYHWADAVLVDPTRKRTPISSTQVRNMPFHEAYRYLPREYQVLVNRKVLFTGTESCGKSTLVRKLAAVLNTSFTEEQGKLACERYGVSSPLPEIYPQFVHAQKEANAKAVANANMVALCDTDAVVTAFYLDLYEGEKLPLAWETARGNGWDMVFFVEPCVPWVADGLRLHGDQQTRMEQAARLKTAYGRLGYRLVVLDGDYKANYDHALREIRALLGYRDGEEE